MDYVATQVIGQHRLHAEFGYLLFIAPCNIFGHQYCDKNFTYFTGDNSSDLDEISGTIHTLNCLKVQVKNLNVEDYPTIPIIQEGIRTLRRPGSFLNHVLWQLNLLLNVKCQMALLGLV